MSATNTAVKWNASLMFPTTTDTSNRIIGVDFSPSKSSGNPMVKVDCEVVGPQEMEIDGKMVTVAGVKTTNYFVTTVLGKGGEMDTDKTEKARKNFKEFYKRMGLDPETINWDNVDVTPLKGLIVLTFMDAEPDERRANPTAAELAANPKAQGKILKNPLTGQALVNYWPKIREFFGLAPEQEKVNAPY